MRALVPPAEDLKATQPCQAAGGRPHFDRLHCKSEPSSRLGPGPLLKAKRNMPEEQQDLYKEKTETEELWDKPEDFNHEA